MDCFINNSEYKERVKLLLQLIPIVSGIDDFAIHGGTAINLFVLDLPRYSVDIDVTYIPIKSREETFLDIRTHLTTLKEKIKRLFPSIVIEEKPNKINCLLNGILVKIEVNGTKRGLVGRKHSAIYPCGFFSAQFIGSKSASSFTLCSLIRFRTSVNHSVG
ncbi:nucleotidyl transferase AbiEii/AbiGii toxin family protein, partial [Viscerimonas tarda]